MLKSNDLYNPDFTSKQGKNIQQFESWKNIIVIKLITFTPVVYLARPQINISVES